MQVRNLGNRLRVNMVCELAWVSIPGERDLPKSLNWCVRTHGHRLLVTMALKQKKQTIDVQ